MAAMNRLRGVKVGRMPMQESACLRLPLTGDVTRVVAKRTRSGLKVKTNRRAQPIKQRDSQ